MAVYQYRAKLGPEQILEGTIEASDERTASQELTSQGYFLISLSHQKAAPVSRDIFKARKKVSSNELALFTSQLADLVEAGMPIYQALNVIAKQMTNPRFADVITDVATHVRKGDSLSGALGRHASIFSNLYIGMVQSGEESGTLDAVLKRLRTHLEQTEELKRNIKSALIYPSFVLGVGLLSIVVLLTVVIPRLVGLFEDVGQSLPLPTRIILAASNFFTMYWWVLLLVVVILVALYQNRRTIKAIDRAVEFLKLKTPLVRQLHLKKELSEYSRTLSTLLTQKVPMIQALKIALHTIDNKLLRRRMIVVSDMVANGEKFHIAQGRADLFTPFMLNVISVGEEGGRLEAALNKVADMYQLDIATTTKRLTTLLEPAIIFLLAIGLGFIIFAIILPILQLELFEF
jgi:general secretion pathway protein F